jgi:hypothetical protein
MKKSTKQAVNKSLTPEEKAILGNIRSLLEQLDSEETSEDMNAPATDDADVMASADEEEVGTEVTEEEEEVEKCDDPNKVKKSTTPDEVANNDAEERLTAEDTDTEKALAVLKAILTKGEVKKSARTVKKSADYARLEGKVDALTDAVESMIAGFGLVKTPAPVAKSSQILNRLEAIVNKSANNARREGDLSDVMTSLFGANK